MSDCEMLCWENAERRRHAEEYDDRLRLEEAAYEEQLRLLELDARAEARREKELKMWQRWTKAARVAVGIHLGVSAVLALCALPVWAAMGAVATVFYFTLWAMARRMSHG